MRSALWVGLFVAAALVALGLGWGFTVDDALISTRVAHYLNTVGRYAFNREGPRVDCVTPLGWAWLLSPWSGAGPWAGLQAARALGVACALGSAALLGWLVASCSHAGTRNHKLAATVTASCLALNLPFGAWSSSGMETSLVMLLCTAALVGLRRGVNAGAWAASIAAGLRPELLAWAMVLNLAAPAINTQRRLTRLLLVLTIPVAVAVTRAMVFGSPAPMAVWAKPSDTAHGLGYAWAALRLLGLPLLLLGYRAYRSAGSLARAVALAAAAHVLAIVVAGGDWMSLFRLFVPILPSLAWLGFVVTQQQRPWLQCSKGLLALLPSLALQLSLGAASRQVISARSQLIAELAPLLAESHSVATLDVGWVGAATQARITDFAGVTDPEVAYLPGGHTSKRLSDNLLERRAVDTLVLLLAPAHPPLAPSQPLTELRFARDVEYRAVRLYGAERFLPVARLGIAGTDQDYLVLQRAPAKF